MTYYTHDGDVVTADTIKAAFDAGNAVIICGRGDGKTTTKLAIDGRHWDTRGECFSVWEESWTITPSSVRDALAAAYART